MRRKFPAKQLAILLFVLSLNLFALAQHKSLIGLNLTGEFISHSKFVTGAGALFESRLGRHGGLETGLYYRRYYGYGRVYANGITLASGDLKPAFISVPVLYKWYSSFLNFSVGPSFDVYLGTQTFRGWPPNTKAYDGKKFYAGAVGKLSRTIHLADRFVLEPELRFNQIIGEHRAYYGIGVAGKWAL